ncbi:hypothetical protein BCR33DRAFT_780893 [Rhizoclosmatium globosum]|uniref:CBS domain-containing protein n=1 Tax=Rhizoclosmatium globosum TaxID=329046 RepID=A0A1Y2CXG2_9FUNG|nr:hypothetical protein BCR33DRAFT_780893 [Rhizoclosmatium globosum]|eukprot:ORY51025.1 hypothetical protein BCR33DRAFT_780893 [Rhizoclosmatium globosum]
MSKQTLALQPKEQLATLRKVLQTTTFHGFPVVERNVTNISGEDIIAGNNVTLASPGTLGFGKFKPLGYITRNRLLEIIEDSEIAQVPDSTVVHLEALCKACPTMGRDNSSASKLYQMFRKMGLKRAFVVDGDGFLEGIVTRRDLVGPINMTTEKEFKTVQDLAVEIAEKYRV